jgi:TPR repeat protein
MEKFDNSKIEESFKRFERAAAKGHEESIWILSVVKDVEMKMSALTEAFPKTEEPLGWYFAGRFAPWRSRERFDFHKKSAEGGCSWGQVGYRISFKDGVFVEQDNKVYVEWLEKAANQNNPEAMAWLGNWFRYEELGDDKEKAVSYYRAAAELGWKSSMHHLARMLKDGEGCVKDLRQAVIWGAKGDSYVFWMLLGDARRAFESGATENLDCDFNRLCYALGWGLYWYQYGTEDWDGEDDEVQVFGNDCLDYYCSCVELQQKSIVAFLLCWNQTTGGIKGPGQMIAEMVWEGREENLVQKFEESDGEEPETKRIKK